MEREVRYCTTDDGVHIAFSSSGKGYPLVRTLGWFSHLEFEAHSPLWRGMNEALSSRFQYIRYDGRGTGLSPSGNARVASVLSSLPTSLATRR